MSNFQDTSVTVFFTEDGTVCDPFDDDVYLCASFAPGGLIVDYRFVGQLTSPGPQYQRSLHEFSLDCVTVMSPINTVDDLRNALVEKMNGLVERAEASHENARALVAQVEAIVVEEA